MSGRNRSTGRAIRVAAVTTLALIVAACGAGEGLSSSTPADVPETVALGEIPELPSDSEPPPNPPTTAPATTSTTVPADEQIDGPISERVLSHRVLLIGDSVLASTAPRTGGVMCDVLTGFGWTVAIDAEPGRAIDFAHRVLDERLAIGSTDEWDVAAIFLGNNFNGDFEGFTAELDTILERLAPRPVIIYTVTETDDDRARLNEIIRERTRFHRDIVVLDWAEITATDPELLLASDGLHLTEAARQTLVVHTAAALGETPGDTPGECLPSPFQDDSLAG